MLKRIPVWFLLLMVVAGFGAQEAMVYAQNSVAYSSASLIIWTDKYAYLPGESITLRWTARANLDGALYTAVVYLQNNQTGAKTYLSMPGTSTDAADIFGRTPEQGFFQVILGDVTKGVVIGTGGWLRPQITAPADLGMYTFVLELRDATGTRVVKSAYTKMGVVNGFEVLSGDITANRTLVNTKAYNLSGRVLVTNNATLTIEPGTFIFGQPGSQPPSFLMIGVNGKLAAAGTRSRPIVMTSFRSAEANGIGLRNAGDWGGLVLLGKAPVNVTGGVNNIEGLPPSADTTYGGTDATHNCGTLTYVRVEFAGALLSPNNEINAVTFGGCGTQTLVHHVQVRYGLDDAFEWFGGTADAKYLVGDIAKDDYVDGQLGWSGRLQHAILVAGRDVQGNRGIEMDNSELDDKAAPQGKPRMYNLTFVGAGDLYTRGSDENDTAAIYLRRGAGGSYNNMVLYNWMVTGIDIRENTGSTATRDSIVREDLRVNGILMFDNGKASGRANDLSGQVANFSGTSNALGQALIGGTLGSGRNILISDPLLRRPVDIWDPDFLPRAGSPVFRANWVQPPDDGFFDQWARWSGAFGDVDWTEEWTVWAQEGELRP